MRYNYILKIGSVFIFFTIIAIVLMDNVVMPLFVHATVEVRVPEVTRKSLDEAKKILESKGLTFSVKYHFDPNLKDHTVVSQSPEPQSIVKTGREIRLIASQEELLVTMPALKLTTLRDATFTLQTAGLRVGEIVKAPSREFPEGIVLEQSVEENTKIKSGSKIDLTLSAGDTSTVVKIPWLVSKTLKEAKLLIVDAGLRIGEVKKHYESALLPETVLQQSLDTLQAVPPQTRMDITVSSLDKEDR